MSALSASMLMSNIVTHGIITTIAGTGTYGNGADGSPATSRNLSGPCGVAVDSVGNVYIADSAGQLVRKVSGTNLTTIAGTGSQGTGSNGPATACALKFPSGVAVDSTGNVYIADSGNHRVMKVSGGNITVIAGTGSSGNGTDGLATACELTNPYGVAVDSVGNVYIADSQNNRVRKVSGTTITTIAGTGVQGNGPDGGLATECKLSGPYGVAVDAVGDIYIADTNNYRVRKVSGTTITTIAGTGGWGNGPDGGLATACVLATTNGVAVDSAGNVYISDYDYPKVRKVS